MIVSEIRQWRIWPCSAEAAADPAEVLRAARSGEGKGAGFAGEETLQVHDLLRQCVAISPQAFENGRAEDCGWVGDSDWVYRAEFAPPPGEGPHFLHCRGLDTVCDLFLNGRHIGSSRSMYLPFRAAVTGLLEGVNELLIYFHRHDKMLAHYERSMPEEWRGNVPPEAMLMRMHDYGHRPADRHGFKPIGIFDRVTIETAEHAELSHTDIEVTLNAAHDRAAVAVTLTGSAYDDARKTARVTITDPGGKALADGEIDIAGGAGEWEAALTFRIDNPMLWWPQNYGGQPLYRLRAVLMADGAAVGEATRPFGIRSLRKTGNMVFECNGVPIRFWGADIAPVWGPSNTFRPDYVFPLIERIELLGINAVRVWGPSQPYPDEFYDRFDQLGILLWQDFPTGGSQLPDSEEYRALLCEEAARMVRRLKHHPCIYLWCGGNENIYMCELRGESETHGFQILTHDFRDVCAALDPQRYYHASCPYGGRYTNDPLVGDSHGSRALRAYCPGEQYGAFFSENIRVYPPQYKSFYRWLGDDIWEDGYVDTKPFGCLKAMPAAWQRLVGNNGEEKFGPIWDYYAATNVRELIYKYTAAAGQDLYQMYARSRRGSPAHKSHEGQFCRGQVIWKLNDPWPNFYCALVDYYLEPSLPYYAARRAVRPLWIDFEVADHIYLWGVNDTRTAVSGTLELTLYNLEREEIVRTASLPAALHPGTSRILLDLDSYGFLHWFTLLHARLLDERGEAVAVTNQYLTKENMMPFHAARVQMAREGDELVVTTDQFARCVELSAGEDGCAFGWVFEDNYFDLFPFETKRIPIRKRGEGGCIRAQAQYSPHIATLSL